MEIGFQKRDQQIRKGDNKQRSLVREAEFNRIYLASLNVEALPDTQG